jgi:hypothetical protein
VSGAAEGLETRRGRREFAVPLVRQHDIHCEG